MPWDNLVLPSFYEAVWRGAFCKYPKILFRVILYCSAFVHLHQSAKKKHKKLKHFQNIGITLNNRMHIKVGSEQHGFQC